MKNKRKSFSLIELMIAVSIIGILAAIAIPSYLGIQRKGKRTEKDTNLQILKLCEEKWHAEYGQYVDATDTAALKARFLDFDPGDDADLHYDYSIETPTTQTYSIIAAGKATSSDSGKVFCINQDNQVGHDAECPN